MIEPILEWVPKFIGAVLIYLFTNFSFKKYKIIKTIHKFRRSIKKDIEINHILTELRIIYRFNRVSIIDYHNGTDSFSGFSFKYATMTYENTDNITKEIISIFKDIPCSIITNMLQRLENATNGFVVIEDEKMIDETSNITHTMYGIKGGVNFRIGKSLINGCVSCVYTHDGFQKLSAEDIIAIKSAIQKIYLLRIKT